MSISGATPMAVKTVEERSGGWVSISTRLAGLLFGLIAIAVSALLSLRYGSLEISTANAWNAIFAYDPAVYEQTVVRELRVPRTLIALSVGGALGVAGP